MDGTIISLWITSGATAAGIIYAIVRNGSRRKQQDEKLKTELKMEIKAVKTRLDDPDSGLTAIKKSTDDMKLHCAEISTAVSSQVQTNREEIAILRKKKR